MNLKEETSIRNEEMIKTLKNYIETEAEDGRVILGIIAVTVEPTGTKTSVMINRNHENAFVKMGYIEEGELTDILQNQGKRINHKVKRKISRGMHRALMNMKNEKGQ